METLTICSRTSFEAVSCNDSIIQIGDQLENEGERVVLWKIIKETQSQRKKKQKKAQIKREGKSLCHLRTRLF